MLRGARPRHPSASNRLSLIGVPTDAGASCRGAALGPDALRAAGLGRALQRLGYLVDDLGNMRTGAGAGWGAEILMLARRASAAAARSLHRGARPVFLGGDHSVSIGSIAGVARHCRAAGRELFVLWLDAHGDFNTPRTSQTGNIHGMSLALLCGEPEFAPYCNPAWYFPVDPRNVTIFGARSLDREEARLIAARGVEVVDMAAIREAGVAAPLSRLIERVAAVNGHLHVSLDVDAMDPAVAPGVGTCVPGGIGLGDAHLIMQMLHESGLVGSLDIVELNPLLDEDGRSATLLVDLAESLFGTSRAAAELSAAS